MRQTFLDALIGQTRRVAEYAVRDAGYHPQTRRPMRLLTHVPMPNVIYLSYDGDRVVAVWAGDPCQVIDDRPPL